MPKTPFDLPAFYREVDARYREQAGPEVLRFLVSVLARAQAAGDVLASSAVASELGSVLRVRGEFEAAAALYAAAIEALDRAEAADSRSRVNLRINLGDVYAAAGDAVRAIELFDEAEALLIEPAHHPYELSAILNNRSSAYRAQGRLDRARQDLRRAAELLDGVPNAEGNRAVNGINLAQILMEEGRLDEAEEVLVPVLAIYEHLTGGRDIHRPAALATAAQVARLRGEYALAGERYTEAIDALADKVGESEAVDRLRRERERVERLARG